MPAYLPYPTKKETPNRKTRKGDRAKVFLTNKNLAKKLRKERLAARKEAEETLEEAGE
jgi:hypothetical protein